MKRSELRDERNRTSKAASDQARTLALAGLAVVWLFVADFFVGKPSSAHPSNWLTTAGALFALALLFDFLQLLLRAISLYVVYRGAERRTPDMTEDPDIPTVGFWPNRVTMAPFFFKSACLLAGYGVLAYYFFSRL